jgi:hypothetical protein
VFLTVYFVRSHRIIIHYNSLWLRKYVTMYSLGGYRYAETVVYNALESYRDDERAYSLAFE